MSVQQVVPFEIGSVVISSLCNLPSVGVYTGKAYKVTGRIQKPFYPSPNATHVWFYHLDGGKRWVYHDFLKQAAGVCVPG